MMFKLTSRKLEFIDLTDGFRSDEAGAFHCFQGLVRNGNQGRTVTSLDYETDDVLCQNEAQKIFDETRKKFDVIDLRCYHRLGQVKVGEMSVWIGVLATHRDDAFQACRYMIDEMKKRLPIWKKEFYADGHAEWIDGKE